HKQKRKEAEYTILQERLQKLTNEQNHGAKLGIRVINPSGKKMSSLSQVAVKSKSEKHEKDLFAHTIQTYEDREKQLLLETDSLKSCLYNVFTRIKAAVSSINKATGRTTTIVLSNEPHEQARFHLPFALVRDQIEELFEGLLGEIEGMTGLLVDSLQAIKEAETVKSGMVGIAETEEAVQQLQNEIAEYKLIIERQKHLIEMALDTSHEGVRQNSFLGENDLLADIEEQKLMIARRSEQLDEERRKFTEAAIRLGRERCAFEKEKEEFEDEKRFAATQKILTDMPDTPIWMKKSSAPVEKVAKTPNSPSLSTRKPSTIPPKTPTPLSISTQQQRTRAASTPTTAKPTQQRIRTPTDTIRTPSASKTASSTPAYSRIHATSSEVIAEGLTFASTPGILGVRERPGLDDGVVRGSGGGVVKSVLKKSGGGGHLVGSAGKRKVVIEEGAKENWGM
ncbi:Afadin- and alpha-actinin-binding protein, partial [Rhizoclosmatium hyalinum]